MKKLNIYTYGITFILLSFFFMFLTSCNPTIHKTLSDIETGKSIIQHENGKYSEPLPTRKAFEQLKDNEKLYLSSGRVIFKEPLVIEKLKNIQIIGNNTSIVAKIDMPIITFKNIDQLSISDILVVHEIGEWCAQNCVEIYNSSNINIKDSKFDGSGYFGLALTRCQNASIENNKFFNCEYGLAAWDSSGLSIKNNHFSKNRAQDIQVNDKKQFINDFTTENTFEK